MTEDRSPGRGAGGGHGLGVVLQLFCPVRRDGPLSGTHSSHWAPVISCVLIIPGLASYPGPPGSRSYAPSTALLGAQGLFCGYFVLFRGMDPTLSGTHSSHWAPVISCVPMMIRCIPDLVSYPGPPASRPCALSTETSVSIKI